ncbi:hypothetical protein Y032_0074g857 [Ancylostoma ceylanicum]|uniref:SHSP domain-containing protein n=1 Tax=Ancylostoma ceylanicum TaxID=53326 RepID=A0A016TUL8_9BILA|nr:hypothetical protein Y032_0074g857 [Ancylostoma ceylanicum]
MTLCVLSPVHSQRAPTLLDNLLDDLDLIEAALRSVQRLGTQRQHEPGCFNESNCDSEDLKVDFDGRILKIESKQETQGESGSSKRTIIRAWALPDNTYGEQIGNSPT